MIGSCSFYLCFDSKKVDDLLAGDKITKDEKMALIALTRLIIEKDAIIAKREIDIKQKEIEIARKETDIARKEIEIAKKDTDIARKETDIAGFVSDLKAALSKLQDLQPRALLGTHSAFRFSFSSLLF